MGQIKWEIPQSNLNWINRIPKDRPIVLLLRHSVRPDSDTYAVSNEISITPDGYEIAKQFGALLSEHLRSIHSSPVLRCKETAEAILFGAKLNLPIFKTRYLGDPSLFISDSEETTIQLSKLGFEKWMRYLTGKIGTVPGMANPNSAARFLTRYMFATAGTQRGIHLFITHDSIISATVSQLISKELGKDEWPWYL
ncbi:MAG: histidine phosphatase family protein, partial [Candidatus Electryoneaceae bacterium]|nr:histidine phosphatase family protein [Candidatus Electryoneaceae bacterium]